MPTHSAEAIVLRQYSLAEADRIVVFFSREFGKVRAVAKGAKRPRSHIGGCLEPLNRIQIEFYAREGRDLGRVTRCELLHSFLGCNPSPENMILLSYLSEIINEIVQENNPNPLLYRLFLATLTAGEATGMNQSLVRYFELWSLKLIGLLPNHDYCSNCSRCVKDVGFYAWLEAGQARCEACAGSKGIRIRPVTASALQAIWALSPERFASRPLPTAAAEDLERLSRKLLEWHLEKQLKSLPAVRRLFSDRPNP